MRTSMDQNFVFKAVTVLNLIRKYYKTGNTLHNVYSGKTGKKGLPEISLK